MWSASQRALRFLQKSQLRFARVRFNGVMVISRGWFLILSAYITEEEKQNEKRRKKKKYT